MKETLNSVAKALKKELEAKNCGLVSISKCTYCLSGRKHPVAISRTLHKETSWGFSIIEIFRKGRRLFWRKPISIGDYQTKAKKIAIEFLKTQGIQERDIIYQPDYLRNN